MEIINHDSQTNQYFSSFFVVNPCVFHCVEIHSAFYAYLFNRLEFLTKFYQLDHVTFSKNVFWYVDFALSFCQVCYVQNSTLWLV